MTLRPSFALGGWIARHGAGTGNDVMAIGDLVLLEGELPAVMRARECARLYERIDAHVAAA